MRPVFLKKGDIVGIVCTARKFTHEEAQPAIDLLASWGLKVRLGQTIGLDNHQLGGSDAQRAKDLQDMIDDDSVKAIWCARGGYGTVRIIDRIDFSGFDKNPKWVIGFSDITVLHSHIHNLGVASLHAIMPFSVPKAEDKAKESLKACLFGELPVYKVKGHTYNKSGRTEGVLVGGNLSILYSLLGSASALNTDGKILYLEDLDEYLYHIDRMIMNLKRNGCFENLKGLVIGGMTDMHDNAIPFGMDVYQIVRDLTQEYSFPICFDFPAGHIPDNRALILGSKVCLEVSSDQTILSFMNSLEN